MIGSPLVRLMAGSLARGEATTVMGSIGDCYRSVGIRDNVVVFVGGGGEFAGGVEQ